MKYSEFIKTKTIKHKNIGFKPSFMPEILFDFQNDLVVSTGSVEHTLRVMGAFKYTAVRRKQRSKKEVNEKLKSRLAVKNMAHTNDICTCCRTKTVAPGNRFLCSSCYVSKSQIETYNSGVSIG